MSQKVCSRQTKLSHSRSGLLRVGFRQKYAKLSNINVVDISTLKPICNLSRQIFSTFISARHAINGPNCVSAWNIKEPIFITNGRQLIFQRLKQCFFRNLKHKNDLSALNYFSPYLALNERSFERGHFRSLSNQL